MTTEIKGETDHCRERLIKYCQGQGIDLGCGRTRIKIDAIGIDLFAPLADVCMDARQLKYPNNLFDYIFSSHLLEEIENTEATLKEWLRVLKPKGNLVLYQADKDLYYPIGHPACNSAHKHHFCIESLSEILKNIGGTTIIHSGQGKKPEWSFELVAQKL